jgi:hypothetical protein
MACFKVVRAFTWRHRGSGAERLRIHPAVHLMRLGCSFPGAGEAADHSRIFAIEMRNDRSFTSRPIYTFMECRLCRGQVPTHTVQARGVMREIRISTNTIPSLNFFRGCECLK